VTFETVVKAEQKLRLFDEAERFLAKVNDAADELDVTLPDRQYITIGEAVFDCEQVAVTLGAVSIGLPNMPQVGINEIGNCCPPGWSMHLVVDIVRCVPQPVGSGTAPVAADRMNASAAEFAADTAVLLDATAARMQDNLFGNLAATIQYPPPSGIYGTSRLLLQLGVH
jgi:hypothetical protein